MAELALSVRGQSQTYDEAYHLLAGYRYWQAQDFGINPEHPPLAKWVASLPLLYLSLQAPTMAAGDEYFGGRKFLYATDADALLFRARMAGSAFTLLVAILVFEATYLMFGRGPAFLALALVVFDPNILAHGALVTTDMAQTFCLFAAVYAFYRYVKSPTTWRLAECGFVAGLALAAKHSGILVFPILGSLALAELLMGRSSSPVPEPGALIRVESIKRQTVHLALALMLITAIAVTVLWGLYAFRFQARPDGLMTPPVQYLKSPAKSQVILALWRWRALPESYLHGLVNVMIGGERPTFLFGEVYPRGQWFYFPAAFLIKSTLGLLLLLFLTLIGKALRRKDIRREVLFVTIPPTLFFAVSLTSGLNLGLRHVLPVYPFLLVLAAAGAWSLTKQHRRWGYIVAALILFHALSSVRSFPNYLAYSNEIWGGPANTYKVLADSNVDWGQGLKAAKRYLDRHHITQCWFAYFGTVDPAYYDIPCKLLPAFGIVREREQDVIPEIIQGTVLISGTELSGQYWGPGELNPYEPFRRAQPLDTIGGSILVFEGRFDVALASARSRINKTWELVRSKRLDQALAEARTAVAMAPRNVQSHYVLGYVLAQKKRKTEARLEYQTALSLAQTIHPEYQAGWVQCLQKELSEL